VIDILLPTTDRAVAIQLAVVLVAGALGLFATRRQPDVRILVIGVVLVLLGGMGLRALH